jgi:hypothetical protein
MTESLNFSPSDSPDKAKVLGDIINKKKWVNFLRHFIDVLRINILIVDTAGKTIIPPAGDGGGRSGRYGSRFLTTSFKFDFSGKSKKFLEDFVSHGYYLEAKDCFEFHAFAIPIKTDQKNIFAYLLVGPIILNKGWNNEDYTNVAHQMNIEPTDDAGLIDLIQEIRVVSHVTMKAILDLLAEVAKNILEIEIEKHHLHQQQTIDAGTLPQRITEAAKDLYATIHLDELLITVLDLALNLTQAECGSIMIMDKQTQELTIKVSRGIDQKQVMKTRLKMGEGIAGIAAQDNTPFIIKGTKGNSRIQHLLKRANIKEAVIVPLAIEKQVFGVLNLHTKSEGQPMITNLNNIRHLSRLISTSLQTL